jgi:hypothetical protein
MTETEKLKQRIQDLEVQNMRLIQQVQRLILQKNEAAKKITATTIDALYTKEDTI